MAYTVEQQKIINEATGSGAYSSLSSEAQYYRTYGSFKTTPLNPQPQIQPQPQTQSQTQLQTQTGQSQTGLYKVPTQGIGPDGQPIYDIFSNGQYIQDPNDPKLKGVNLTTLPTGTAPTGFKSKFQQGFDQANKELGGNIADNQGASIVDQYAPSAKNDLAAIFNQNDSFMTGLTKAWQDYINPQNQRVSLTDTYNQMVKDSGIEGIDMQLVDMKKIIEGTEDDIRTEITKSGGFATDSQVLALSNARNKQLIKNYNTLLDTRNAKEKYLQTAIGLEAADRQAADQRFEQMFSMGVQLQQMQQQMQQNTIAGIDRLQKAIGWDGIDQATQGDPHLASLIERTYGLPQGGLKIAAQQAMQIKARAEEERQLNLQEQQLGMQLKGEQIKTEQAQRSKIYSDISNSKNKVNQTIEKINGQDMMVTKDNNGVITKIESISTPSQKASPQKLAQNESTVQQLGNIMTNNYLLRAVGPNALQRYSFLDQFTGGKTNLIADIEQIRSQLNIKTLLDAKAQGATFGQLSNQELQVLASAATKIGTWAIADRDQFGNITNVKGYKASPSQFLTEIQKIQNFSKLDYLLSGGDPVSVGVFQTPDGKWVSWNVDGSLQDFTEDLTKQR